MLKYSLGLDISAKAIQVCISVIDAAQKVTVKSTRKIDNTLSGFKDLEQWVNKHHKHKDVPLVVTMEATGVYYENCALYLFKQGYSVSVLLPNKAKSWLKAEGLKSKNDKIDAQGLSKIGAEKALELWQPVAEYFYELRAMTRQYQSLQEFKTGINNQLHAEEHGMYKNKLVIKQLKQQIKFIEKQLADIEAAIEVHIASDNEIAERVKNICKIKGLGILTVAVILAETNGFALFKNIPQLVSYSGYDAIENQSGDHVGKTRISKKGNSRIRRALFMPAFNMIKFKQTSFVELYNRTLEKHGLKMKSYVAVQKKLLVLIYSLWKNNTAYDVDYKNKNIRELEQALPLGMVSAEATLTIAV